MIPVLPNLAARRLFLSHHHLTATPTGSGKGADLLGLIEALGFVQLDSVNTVARAHDLTLWARRQSYRPRALEQLLARDRSVFEHWTHDASVIPVAYFPHWQHRFARDAVHLIDRWQQWHSHDFADRFEGVLKRIADHGECTSGELAAGEVRGKTGWWDWHPSKTALEFLWRTGQISVVRRDGFRKVYDLTARVIPAAQLLARPDPAETIDWACSGALDRLGFATSGELSAFWALVTPDEAKQWCAAALADRRIIPVDVGSADGGHRRCFARPDLLDRALSLPAPRPRIRILSPFDPALRDRNRAERLFGFHYRIEIFVPEALRKYGYYVFPVLEGATVIGRIDMKAQRGTSGNAPLAVRALWPEAGVAFGAGRAARLRTELDRVARFAGCDRVEFAEGWVRGT